MKTVRISHLARSTTRLPLNLSFEIENKVLWQGQTSEHLQNYNFAYDSKKLKDYNFTIRISGKQHLIENTTDPLDEAIETCVYLADFRFDGFDIYPMVFKHSTYSHNFNNTAEHTTESFPKYAGCDGVIEFNLILPLCYWFITDYEY